MARRLGVASQKAPVVSVSELLKREATGLGLRLVAGKAGLKRGILLSRVQRPAAPGLRQSCVTEDGTSYQRQIHRFVHQPGGACCGNAERRIKKGKLALRWTRLSSHAFRHNAVRLQLHALAYNLVYRSTILRHRSVLKRPWAGPWLVRPGPGRVSCSRAAR